MFKTMFLTLETSGGFSVKNVTDELLKFVEQTGVMEGQAFVFYQHTTGGVILMEYEAGIMADLEEVLDEIAPVERVYRHHLRGVDFNGHAHIRSALIGADVTIPIQAGKVLLGRYQQIMIIDMQTENQPRSVVFQVIGE